MVGMGEHDTGVQGEKLLADIVADIIGIDGYDDMWCYAGLTQATCNT